MAEHYFTVGTHGAPTPETAPHGFGYVADGDWKEGVAYDDGAGRKLASPHTVWWPLPAPPTEQAPPPEPVARWEAVYRGVVRAVCGVIRDLPETELQAAADALNALDANGVAWGPGRPMAELPDGHPEPVLIGYDGVVGIDHRTDRGNDAQYDRRCWWPLPGEAQ